MRPSWGHGYVQQQVAHAKGEGLSGIASGLVLFCSALEEAQVDPYTWNSQSMYQSTPQHLSKLRGVLQDAFSLEGKTAIFHICQLL